MPANPFEFEAANKFTIEEMASYFITDETYTRFVASRKNVFLLGDRGTGKTMALRYYSLPVQEYLCQTGQLAGADLLDFVGVYVPCRKPGLNRTEPHLLTPFLGRVTGEHLLVMSMIYNLAESLAKVRDLTTEDEERRVRASLLALLPLNLPSESGLFDALAIAATEQWGRAQQQLNERQPSSHSEFVITFAAGFQPLIDVLVRHIARLRHSHFSVMFDDAEELSDFQNESLNSWIAVRDTSRISFKVATSAVDQRPLRTASGGGLLERHDFIRIDLEQDFQNSEAAYGRLARKIVDRRLKQAGIEVDADHFFPIHPTMEADLDAAKEQAKLEAETQGLQGRQVRDYVHKMQRAIYFRNRSPQANRPPYSGFDLIVHVSTGVVRYLLEPCYEMYDRAISAQEDKTALPTEIPPGTQADCLQQMSKRRWEWVRNGFDSSVKECTAADAHSISQLVDQLAVLFKERLLRHHSEPRAISFSVSGWDKLAAAKRQDLEKLFKTSRRAQILFERLSTGKDDGRPDRYYTFDRLFWIERGLDPVGQNARVSIEARYLWNAAFENAALPFGPEQKMKMVPDTEVQLKLDGGAM